MHCLHKQAEGSEPVCPQVGHGRVHDGPRWDAAASTDSSCSSRPRALISSLQRPRGASTNMSTNVTSNMKAICVETY